MFSSFGNACFAKIPSTSVTKEGRKRSASAIANGQVGKATHAIELIRCSLTPSSIKPCSRASCSMCGF
ncbi:Uncharacterised protein [Vibrio cholerae]|nr:Uncharacterised protein [Vibrio cholerae]